MSADLEKLRGAKNDVMYAVNSVAPRMSAFLVTVVSLSYFSTMQEKVHSIERAFTNLLDDDQELCLMHLTLFHTEPGLFEDLSLFNHEAAEVSRSCPHKPLDQLDLCVSTMSLLFT